MGLQEVKRKPCSVCNGTGVPKMVSTDKLEVMDRCPECGRRPRGRRDKHATMPDVVIRGKRR